MTAYETKKTTESSCPRCGSSGAGGKCASWCPQTPSEAAAEQSYAEKRDAEIRTLAAEYDVLAEYDATRSRLGHDYGSGQRGSELMRRRRELRALGFDVELEELNVTKEERSAAFERVGRPKLRRAEQETFRRETPATSRTLRAWAMVERWATGARAACACGSRHELVEPPASTEEAISGVIRRGDVTKLSDTGSYRRIAFDLEWLDRNVRLDPAGFAADHLADVERELHRLVEAVAEGTI